MAVPQNARFSPSAAAPNAAVVFVSYSHAESALAKAFSDALASCGLEVRIDINDLAPGEDIIEFARRSVRTAHTTVCLVSIASLSSAWVVFEAVSALHKEHADPTSRLIACSTDEAFFREDVRIEVTRTIDHRLESLNQLIGEYLVKQLDMNDLSVERSRLLSMRANLGDVLLRLRNSLTLSLSPQTMAETAARVADHIRATRGLLPSRTDPRDIRGRAEELRRLLYDGQTDDALDRLLDFVREFSDVPKNVRDVTFFANTLRRIDRIEKSSGLAFREAEEQRQPTIYKLLELIDDIEIHPQLSMAS